MILLQIKIFSRNWLVSSRDITNIALSDGQIVIFQGTPWAAFRRRVSRNSNEICISSCPKKRRFFPVLNSFFGPWENFPTSDGRGNFRENSPQTYRVLHSLRRRNRCLVVNPCSDGCFIAVHMRKFCPHKLQNVSCGTSSVFRRDLL